MTRDLEETLNELGPGYREVVDRLTSAYRPLVDAASSPRQRDVASNPSRRGEDAASTGHIFRWTAGYLIAASLLVFLGLGVIFRANHPSPARATFSEAKLVYTVAYAADESSLRLIVASQRADGSWSNDFITRQNAAALRGAGDAASLVAYKKALRYLRSRGLEPLSESELKARGDRAAQRLAENC